ncbi:MAG: hypothetical protein KF746_22305 [Chitinophagaceae bacterium]|nr:hypothetical protein [Chitinophagaceae bacterium]
MGIQQVLNSRDRNQAFFKFLLFFTITTVLIVISIFFSFRMPLKENRELREELKQKKNIEAEQQKFVKKMDEVIVLIDSIRKRPEQAGKIADMKIDNGIKGLNSNFSVPKGIPYARLNEVIVRNLDEITDMQKALARKDDELQKEKQAVSDCRQELDRIKQDLDNIYKR